MDLKKDEFELHGKWIMDNGKIIEDEISKRINFLKDNQLVKIAISESGWEILYQDPNDKRYWELTYNDSESQGGGAPSLTYVDSSKAKSLYGIKD